MGYLNQTGIKPGAAVTVKEVAEYAGTIGLKIQDKLSSLGIQAATMVWVISA